MNSNRHHTIPALHNGPVKTSLEGPTPTLPSVPAFDPRSVMPQPGESLLIAHKILNMVFVGDYDAHGRWNPTGDIGENCYSTEEIEWWCPLKDLLLHVHLPSTPASPR